MSGDSKPVANLWQTCGKPVRELLEAAHHAGLLIRLDGDRLVVNGPKAAQTLGREVLERKVEVITLLRSRMDAKSEMIDLLTKFDDRVSALGFNGRNPAIQEHAGRLCESYARGDLAGVQQHMATAMKTMDELKRR